MTALGLVMLLGITALAVDASFFYDTRNRMAAAADAAALGAAQELLRSGSANLQAFANHEVTLHHFNPNGEVTVTVNSPPQNTGSPFYNNANFVEVIVSRDVPTFFMKLYGRSAMTVGARAVAGIGVSSSCLITLGSTGVGLSIDKNSVISAAGCALSVNSTDPAAVTVLQNTTVTAASIDVTGGTSINPSSTVTPPPNTGAPPAFDPLASLPAPTPGSCFGATPYVVPDASTVTLDAHTYCGLQIGKNSFITLNAGIYIITGTGLSIGKSTSTTGSGVMIYNSTGSITVSGATIWDLSAPTSGTYTGIVLFQDRANANAVDFLKDGTYTLSGAFYLPSADLTFGKSAGLSTDCALFIVNSINMVSSDTLSNTCSAFGGSPIHLVTVAE